MDPLSAKTTTNISVYYLISDVMQNYDVKMITTLDWFKN